MATIYHTRPSAILEINDPYTAYQFDQAALWWASQERERQDRKRGHGKPGGSARPASGAMPGNNGRIRIPVSKEQAKAKS
jgi:hypothetical protein